MDRARPARVCGSRVCVPLRARSWPPWVCGWAVPRGMLLPAISVSPALFTDPGPRSRSPRGLEGTSPAALPCIPHPTPSQHLGPVSWPAGGRWGGQLSEVSRPPHLGAPCGPGPRSFQYEGLCPLCPPTRQGAPEPRDLTLPPEGACWALAVQSSWPAPWLCSARHGLSTAAGWRSLEVGGPGICRQ